MQKCVLGGPISSCDALPRQAPLLTTPRRIKQGLEVPSFLLVVDGRELLDAIPDTPLVLIECETEITSEQPRESSTLSTHLVLLLLGKACEAERFPYGPVYDVQVFRGFSSLPPVLDH